MSCWEMWVVNLFLDTSHLNCPTIQRNAWCLLIVTQWGILGQLAFFDFQLYRNR